MSALMLGVIMMGLAVLASKMGGLVQATASVFGALSGPTLGLFVLGTTVPYCNRKGAIAGCVFSTVVMVWLSIGSQFRGMKTVMLPLSTDDCGFNNTYSVTTDSSAATTELYVTDDPYE
ncbi:hypothetical protein FHG87_023862 [Trinorchestia longiramus]|nr:hypothetical protein FHG87_023862 [Trinorchestia longiramus]